MITLVGIKMSWEDVIGIQVYKYLTSSCNGRFGLNGQPNFASYHYGANAKCHEMQIRDKNKEMD